MTWVCLWTEELHCNKTVSDFPVPSLDVTNQTLPVAENNLIIPGREVLFSDIPAWDGKSLTYFYSVFYINI